MFNLDGKDKSNQDAGKEQFLFDIEDQLKKDPEKLNEYNQKVAEKLKKCKKYLEEGVKPEELPLLKGLIEGYTAMAKILAAVSINFKKDQD